MKRWRYVEPGNAEADWHITHELSEEAILRHYWSWWCDQMFRVHKLLMCTEQHCIEDWVVVHWATEVNE